MLSFLASLLASPAGPAHPRRVFAAERLEPRHMLAAAGLVEVGAQPSGALDDKIVYLHGGHGITASGSSWGYQRGLLLDMVEDLGNQDQMSQLADYLWNAGATVVPLRPVGHQVNERVLDNDDPGVSFSSGWGAGSGSVYFGDAGDVRYRFATTSPVETAVATYRPNLPEAGYYPVYAWSPAGTNRATDQLYRVQHSGGATEVTVDHSRVGNGLVYLGTYHFEAGTAGAVEISNRSDDPGKVVVADMIRFGNGMGDITRSGGVSGQPRENEAGLYWVEWHVDHAQGIPTSAYRTSSTDSTATVSLAPRYAEYMNQEGVGVLSDRVLVSFHSNATTGDPATATSRGVLGLHNTSSGGATPNQLLLAQTLAKQVNDDLVAQNGQFEHNWAGRSTVTYQASFNYGEINNAYIGGEFDATIIETGFHDNTQDAQMLRDPRVREAIARATYQGIVDYFRAVDGGATPNIDAPPRVASLSAESAAPGEVTLSWTAGAPSAYAGGAPTGYMIYASTGGRGFDGGTYVAGGATSAFTLTGLDAAQQYYFRVAAVNAGGESPDSEVVAAKPSASTERLLIVGGFDRRDRSLVEAEPFAGGNTADRVRLIGANTYDYVVEVAEAVRQSGSTAAVTSVANEAVASGAVDLGDYDAVVWILGTESSADDTFNPAEQSAVSAYLSGGGKLFVSGSEIGWDLDNLNNGRTFYNNVLRADYVKDDALTYDAAGVAGSIFAGLDLRFDNGAKSYDVGYPDVINPLGGATAAMAYDGGAGTAAIQYSSGATRLVMMGFPFESLVGAGNQTDVMTRVLGYFGFGLGAVGATPGGDFNRDGSVNAADYTVWRDSLNQIVAPLSGADADGSGLVDDADLAVWRATFGQSAAVASVAPAPAVSAASAPNDSLPLISTGTSAAPRAHRPSPRAALPTQAGDSAADAALLLLLAERRHEPAGGASGMPAFAAEEAPVDSEPLRRLAFSLLFD
ncbi:AmiA-like protein [Pirellulimonas nuda]|uniref:AmiA-like protein n=1 Tax=Pirellulimonas nuda TaxID=2528009 RepID=A0A518DI20_9BACT|nr:fibronectin type III domain-containing protein [Pirellulimonas nuda]QDU91128.1 AmiA-like protein [Pirellulimonas nuda]